MQKKYQYFLVFIHLYLYIPHTICVTETATMYLPHNGKYLYTKLMQGDLFSLIPKDLDVGSPIVASHAGFNDGVSVLGGVMKSGQKDYNIIFMWVFLANGTQYSGWPIDVSDYEDFNINELEFKINEKQYNDFSYYNTHTLFKHAIKQIFSYYKKFLFI